MSGKALETRFVVTPHPVLLDGQKNTVAEFLPGEVLGAFLRRTVDGWADDAWEVHVNGVMVAAELLDRVRPKRGTLIEVRALVGKTALYIVAMVALTYFTFGIGSAAAGAGGAAAGAAGAGYVAFTYGTLAATAVYVGGAASGGRVIR